MFRQFSRTKQIPWLFPEFPWFLKIIHDFPWPLSNSLTFPRFQFFSWKVETPRKQKVENCRLTSRTASRMSATNLVRSWSVTQHAVRNTAEFLAEQIWMPRLLTSIHTHTHAHTQPFHGSLDFVRDNPGDVTKRNIHSLTPIVVINRPLSNCWYQQLELVIWPIRITATYNYWYQQFDLLTSAILITDISNSNCWYQQLCIKVDLTCHT